MRQQLRRSSLRGQRVQDLLGVGIEIPSGIVRQRLAPLQEAAEVAAVLPQERLRFVFGMPLHEHEEVVLLSHEHHAPSSPGGKLHRPQP
jgi:hypothetical protein